MPRSGRTPRNARLNAAKHIPTPGAAARTCWGSDSSRLLHGACAPRSQARELAQQDRAAASHGWGVGSGSGGRGGKVRRRRLSHGRSGLARGCQRAGDGAAGGTRCSPLIGETSQTWASSYRARSPHGRRPQLRRRFQVREGVCCGSDGDTSADGSAWYVVGEGQLVWIRR